MKNTILEKDHNLNLLNNEFAKLQELLAGKNE